MKTIGGALVLLGVFSIILIPLIALSIIEVTGGTIALQSLQVAGNKTSEDISFIANMVMVALVSIGLMIIVYNGLTQEFVCPFCKNKLLPHNKFCTECGKMVKKG